MSYTQVIQDTLDYIELNLKAELSADELASRAGFSLFHFYRLFLQYTGMPIMQYIVRRRLVHAIYEISSGRKQIDTALEFGFYTHSGFYKAFLREFDLSPTEYLRRFPVKRPHGINLRQEAHMITHSKLKEILKHWDLNAALTVTDVFGGGANELKCDTEWHVNESYSLQTGINFTGLKTQLAVAKALSDAGFSIALPVKTTNGNDYVTEGERYFCLFNRLEGESLTYKDIFRGDFKSNSLYLGEVIGYLHKALSDYSSDAIYNEVNLFDTVMRWAMPKTKEYLSKNNLSLPPSFYDDYITAFGSLYPRLPLQVIHRNLHLGNIVFKEGKLTGFTNFEISERNVRLFDPCYCSTAILSDSFAENDSDLLTKWPEIVACIIAGYDSISALTEEEKKSIPYVIYSIQMIFIAYCSGREKESALAEVNSKMLLWIYENRHRFA